MVAAVGLLFALATVFAVARVDDGVEVTSELPLPPGMRSGDVVTHVSGQGIVAHPEVDAQVGTRSSTACGTGPPGRRLDRLCRHRPVVRLQVIGVIGPGWWIYFAGVVVS